MFQLSWDTGPSQGSAPIVLPAMGGLDFIPTTSESQIAIYGPRHLTTGLQKTSRRICNSGKMADAVLIVYKPKAIIVSLPWPFEPCTVELLKTVFSVCHI